MSSSENVPATVRPQPAVESLLKTLDQEGEAVERLAEALGEQLAALQTNHQETLMDATDEASRAVSEMHRLRQVRERQTRLLARLLHVKASSSGELAEALATHSQPLADRLRTAHEALRARVHATREQSDELAFALHVAAHIGREMLLAWQHAEAPSRVYTAGGTGSDVTPPRPFVNHLG
ncbi:MAG: flagellar export chaperone FlgN [Bacteroidota bacterium]